MRLDGVTHLTAINETLIINYKLSNYGLRNF